MLTILLTGGCGYIGSHICLELLKEGKYKIIIVDNLCNSNLDGIKRLESVYHTEITFYQIDIRDKKLMRNVFKNHKIDVVIHLAALKSVKESISKKTEYFDNNIDGSRVLLEIMTEHNVYNLIFSSSACVYGNPDQVPIKESAKIAPINPYGVTKQKVEQILKVNGKLGLANYVSLRYFNPIGADQSGVIGENPNGIPENLVPYLLKVLSGELETLNVYGNDYPTKDGTAIRDYLHVVDLAKAHLAAMKYLLTKKAGYEVFNIGTGQGYSVLDVIESFKRNGLNVKYKFAPRREGDAAEVYADSSLANNKLEWKAEYDLDQMTRDAWNWWKKFDEIYSKENEKTYC